MLFDKMNRYRAGDFFFLAETLAMVSYNLERP
jgi:hypothetical protein